MKELLDFNNDNKFVDSLWLTKHEIDDIVHVLYENNIIHRVREAHSNDYMLNEHQLWITSKDGLPPDFIVQVYKNDKIRVDDLLKDYTDINSSYEVRKAYLESTLNVDSLIDILLFPEDWEKNDPKIVRDILEDKNIEINLDDYKERKQREKVIKENKKNKYLFQKRLQSAAIFLFLLAILICAIFDLFKSMDFF